jgi:hypothetical protein
MVRALKKLQSKLSDDGAVKSELASYLIECLVYNVPNPSFNSATYMADMRAVLATIFNATLANGNGNGNGNDWRHVHELMYLFRGSSEWSTDDVHALASTAWEALGFE